MPEGVSRPTTPARTHESHRPLHEQGVEIHVATGQPGIVPRRSAPLEGRIPPARSHARNRRPDGSPLARSSRIMRFRSAARWARAISGRRAANHSTCCSFIRSQGGLPMTASKPPCRFAASQSDQTPREGDLPVEESLLRCQLPGTSDQLPQRVPKASRIASSLPPRRPPERSPSRCPPDRRNAPVKKAWRTASSSSSVAFSHSNA